MPTLLEKLTSGGTLEARLRTVFRLLVGGLILVASAGVVSAHPTHARPTAAAAASRPAPPIAPTTNARRRPVRRTLGAGSDSSTTASPPGDTSASKDSVGAAE